MSYYGGAQSNANESEKITVLVCEESDVPIGRYRCFSEGNLSFLICNVKGAFHAIINRCSHMKVPLDGGRQYGKDFICPVHGARFDIASGKALSGAAVGSLQTYPVWVKDGSIFIELPSGAIGNSG